MTGLLWGLDAESEAYLRGGAVLDPREEFAQRVFWHWAVAESPESVAVLEAWLVDPGGAEEVFRRDWAVFEQRLEQCRVEAGAVADQAYQWVVEQLSAEDPDFARLLAGEPELARRLYAEAVHRFGYVAS